MFNTDQRGFKRAVDCRPPFFSSPCTLVYFSSLSFRWRRERSPTLVGRTSPDRRKPSTHRSTFYMAPQYHLHHRFRSSGLLFHIAIIFLRLGTMGKRLISFHCRISVDPPLFLDFVFFSLDGDKGQRGTAPLCMTSFRSTNADVI